MRRLLFVLVITGGALWAGPAARAMCCKTSADCPHGFACADGVCDPMVGHCACDADCGLALFCVPGATVCTGSASQSCHQSGECVASWQRGCATSADCGPGGFTCVVNGSVCSGGSCQPITECQPPSLPATCEADADCPTAWTCEADTAVTTACVPEVVNCPASGCPPPTGAKSCRPPLFDVVGGSTFVGPPPTPSTCLAGAGGSGGAAGGDAGDAAGGPGGAPSDPGVPLQSGGCHLAAGAPVDGGLAAVLLALLGMVGVRRRR